MIMDGKPLTENERMAVLRTIEGDVEPGAHDFVSALKPKEVTRVSPPRTVEFRHDPIATMIGLRDAASACTEQTTALKTRLTLAAECMDDMIDALSVHQHQLLAYYQRIQQLEALLPTPEFLKGG